jgi:hypothetical protein
MKKCFVVNYWADTDEKVLMVLDCINQLKKLDLDIIYTSLCEVDERISNSVTHTLYSDENDLITIFDYIFKYFPVNSYKVNKIILYKFRTILLLIQLTTKLNT